MSFGIRTLFAITTAIALALYLLVAAPPLLAVPLLVLLHAAIAAVLLTSIVYGPSSVRAFAIGAMFPAGATIVALTWMLCLWFTAGPWEVEDFKELQEFIGRWVFTLRVWSASAWVMEPLVGVLAWSVRHEYDAKRSQDAPAMRDETRDV